MDWDKVIVDLQHKAREAFNRVDTAPSKDFAAAEYVVGTICYALSSALLQGVINAEPK